jgi:predicted Zn-dependent protease
LTVAPYRAGIAGAGIAAVLAWFLARLCGLLEVAPTKRAVVWRFAAGAYILWMAGLTTWAVLPWRNEIEISRLAMHYNPDSLFSRLELTSSLLDAGQTDEAEQLLHRTVRISTATAPVKTVSANAVSVAQSSLGDNAGWIVKLYTRLGLARLKESKFPDAGDAFRTAISLGPTDVFANVGMANYAYLTGDWKVAVESLRIALVTAPQMTQKHMARGQILFQHEQWTDAQAEFAVCVTQQPKSAAPYVALAEAQRKGGNDAAARETLELAVSRGVISAQEAKDRLAMGAALAPPR